MMNASRLREAALVALLQWMRVEAPEPSPDAQMSEAPDAAWVAPAPHTVSVYCVITQPPPLGSHKVTYKPKRTHGQSRRGQQFTVVSTSGTSLRALRSYSVPTFDDCP